MFKKTALIAGIGLALSATAQADYRWEADAGITGGDVDAVTVGGTFYLDSVDTSKGPLSEAAFLDHSSYISAGYNDGKTDGDGRDTEFKDYGIDGRYVTDGAGWILDLGYERSEPDNPLAGVAGPDDFQIDTISIGAGKYLTDSTTLVFTYINADADEGGDVDTYKMKLEHLWQLSWGGVKLDGTYGMVNVDDGDDIDIYELGATYYLNNSVGFGGAYRNTENNGFEVERYTLHAEWFITEQVGVTISYEDAEIEDTDLDADAWMIGARVRF